MPEAPPQICVTQPGAKRLGKGHRILQQGQRVEFAVTEGSKGLQAEDVARRDAVDLVHVPARVSLPWGAAAVARTGGKFFNAVDEGAIVAAVNEILGMDTTKEELGRTAAMFRRYKGKFWVPVGQDLWGLLTPHEDREPVREKVREPNLPPKGGRGSEFIGSSEKTVREWWTEE